MRHRISSSGRRTAVAVGSAALAVALLAGCSSSATGGSTTTSTTSAGSTSSAPSTPPSGSSAPGVTPTEIDVGTISTRTGAIASIFKAFTPGMQAYFDMVNSQGGIDGRKLKIAHNLDDGGQPSTFSQLAHTLIQQDHVFAVGTATYWFTPSLFVETKTPTYGYNVSGNWQGPENLFAAGGSVQDYQTGASPVAYLIKQLKAKSVAVISYGSAIASSYNACHADADNLKAAGIDVSYTDLNAQLAGSYTSAVQRMQQAGADFVMSCMQSSDDITLARAIKQYGLKVHQLWFDGYDKAFLSQYSDLMQGVYFNLNGNVPFEAVKAYPGHYPGMKNYLSMMQKYAPTFVYSQSALDGWQSAALLVAGIKAAGANLTQQNVIDQTNKITDFTSGGLTGVTNWTKAHDTVGYPGCSAFVKVKGSQFVPAVSKAPGVFVCFGKNVSLKNPTTVSPPAGTPGA